MTATLLRLSVVAGSRRVDVAIPPALPVAELLPGLAESLSVESYDGLHLCTVTGSPLTDSAGLASQDVCDGDVLTLAVVPPAPVVHDDVAEVLAALVPDVRPCLWLGISAAALLLLLGAVSAAIAGETRAAAVIALVLLAGGLAVARLAPAGAVVASGAACGYAAAAAGLLASDLRPEAGVVWTAAGGAALAVGALAMVGLPALRLRLVPVLVVAATGMLVGAALAVRPLSLAVVAPALLVLAVLSASAAPWVVAGRLARPRGRIDPARIRAEAAVARELLCGLGVGLAVVQVAVTPVVADHGACGIALACCGSLIALTRAGPDRVPTESMPGRLAGAVGIVMIAATVFWQHPAWRPTEGPLLAGAGGALLATPLLAPRSPVVLWACRAIEAACLMGLLPLLVLTTGVLEEVR